MQRRHVLKGAGRWVCVLGIGLLWLPRIAHAQRVAPPPSHVAPPVVPAAPSVPTRIVLPRIEAGATIPKGAKKLFFVLTGFKITGGFKELAQKTQALEAPLVGKRISVAQLFTFASALQALYVRAGYPLVRVVVSPQALGHKAKVALRVIDGFIERVDAHAIDSLVRPRVLAVVDRLVGKRHLTETELERQLLIAGEAPGLILNAVFAAGKKVGGTVLVLKGRYRPVSVSVYGDNTMPTVFGTGQIVSTFSLNSVLGLGEQLSLSVAGLPNSDFFSDNPTRRYLGGALSVPLGVNGLRFEASGTVGTTTPQVTPAFASQGKLWEASAGLAYDVIKSRDVVLTISGGLDLIDQEVDSLVFSPAVPLNADRLRVLRGTVSGVWNLRTQGTVLTYDATLAHGIDAFGARTAADATFLLPLSRAGADAVFTKLDGHAAITQSLPHGFYATLSGAGQTGFGQPMLTPEQFDISGPQALSGYVTGTLVGDSAWVLRQEVGHSFALPKLYAVVTPYVFGATGEAFLEQPSALEKAVLHASNVGLGAHLNIGDNPIVPTTFSGFIEGSKQFSNDPTQDGWRLLVGGVLRY